MEHGGSHYLRYLVILFGSVLLVDWTLSEIFSLPAEATYQLTKASLGAAMAVAVLGFAFRSRLNIKITLIATGLLSLGLVFCVFAVGHQSSNSQAAQLPPQVDTGWVPLSVPLATGEYVIIDSVEVSIGYGGGKIWKVVAHSPSKEFVITCADTPAWGDCIVPKVGDSWRVNVDDNGRILRLRGEGSDYLWNIQRAALRQKAYSDGSTR